MSMRNRQQYDHFYGHCKIGGLAALTVQGVVEAAKSKGITGTFTVYRYRAWGQPERGDWRGVFDYKADDAETVVTI